jgi:hypothetical protein
MSQSDPTGAARSINVVSAFAEAGIGMAPTAGNNVLDIGEAAANASWSNAELHASMQKHFSLWRDLQQWCVWQLAQNHDLGPGLYGIMFDQEGKQRQGGAVFHAGIGGSSAGQLRLQLYTHVHELGHCFNLMHSWQKQYASPPKPNRPDSLSWMNYPWNYPKGRAAGYWSSFDFRFDDDELIHLRHGFRKDIIMGGSDFIVGASLGRDVMTDPILDDSGLVPAISTFQKSFALGEPVVLELKLRTTDMRGRRAHTWLHPNYGLVRILISRPGGEVRAYEPLIDHLVGERQAVLGVNAARTFKTVNPGAGKPVTVRPAQPDASIARLSRVTGTPVRDPISASQALSCLAFAQNTIGNDKAAQATLAKAPVRPGRKS